MEEIVKRVIESFVDQLENPPDVVRGTELSHIQKDFFEALSNVTDDDVRVRWERNVDTKCGRFRLDFLLKRLSDGFAIGIECDGKDFHTPDRDFKRDTAIIATGMVDKIYRIRGHDIFCHVYDVLQLLARMEPWIVSERGAAVIESRAHPKDLRRDHIGSPGIGFQFATIRFYEPPHDDRRSGITGPFHPTIIEYTQNEER